MQLMYLVGWLDADPLEDLTTWTESTFRKTRKPCKGALLQPTCNHNHKLLAAGSTEIKPSAVFCNFWNFRSSVTLTLDGWGQGHISMHNTCRTTTMPNHLTVASSTTEIWPFEFCEISTFSEVWTLVIDFLERNSKIGLQHAIEQVPYYHQQPSVLSSTWKWQRRESWKSAIFATSEAPWPWP